MKHISRQELVQNAVPYMPRADVEHFPLRITGEQRANLAKLAAYLYQLPQDYTGFNMKFYDNFIREPYEERKCGTIACAAGHGPKAGIAALDGESWCRYVDRVFTNENSSLYTFLFSGSWDLVDQTAHGAAKRTYYALQHGIPGNYHSQINGRGPLCYT